MEQPKNMNVHINDGEAFFCHEVSLNFNPMQVIFDFKCVTPRVDMRSKQGPVINIAHNVVMTDPYHAKRMLELLNRVITDYENEFGEIKKPKALEKMEKKIKAKPVDKKTISAPSYFG
ncbi:DUF3467 domain-containing protein [Nanoarchaeota archaeon]